MTVRLPRSVGTLPAYEKPVQSCYDLGPGYYPEIGPDGMPTGYCIGCGHGAVWDGTGCRCASGYYYPGYGNDCVASGQLEGEAGSSSSSGAGTVVAVAVGAMIVLGAAYALSR